MLEVLESSGITDNGKSKTGEKKSQNVKAGSKNNVQVRTRNFIVSGLDGTGESK